MDHFDKELQRAARFSRPQIPKEIEESINQTLAALPDKETQSQPRLNRPWWPVLVKSFAVVLVVFLALPNLSPNIAQAMEKIPVIGDIVRVVTIRNDIYQDDYHQMTANIPEIQDDSTAANKINNDVQELTSTIIDQFCADMEALDEEAHTSLSIDYDILTDSKDWFTLKLTVYQGAGSSNTYYKFYHIDKKSGEIVGLKDLFQADSDYAQAISEDIQRQMQERMDADDSLTYWLDAEYAEWNFTSIDENHNFYFADDGNLVIVFGKYEVAPGYMGCPEFEISSSVYAQYLKDNYQNLDTQDTTAS